MITVKVAPFQAYENCLWLENGLVEVVVAPDCGARLLRYGFLDRENMLHDPQESEEKFGHFLKVLRPDGQVYPMTERYQASSIASGLLLRQLPEDALGLVHSVEFRLTYGSSELSICHTLENTGTETIPLTAFSITSMEEGGLMAIPQSTLDTGDAPNRLFAVWPGTNMSDPRILWGQEYVLVQQANMRPVRFGMATETGISAYFNMECLLVTNYTVQRGKNYPHMGCNIEIATSERRTDLILPNPSAVLRPGDKLVHEENWTLYSNMPCPPVDEWPVGEALRGML